MIIGQMHNLHVTGMSTWYLYYLHDCMLQMWVHDDGIICTIACYGIWKMIFLIVIVNLEDYIIVLLARNSVLQFSSRFCWVILQFAFEVEDFTICHPFQLQLQASTLYLDGGSNLHRGPTYLYRWSGFYNCQFYQIMCFIISDLS